MFLEEDKEHVLEFDVVGVASVNMDDNTVDVQFAYKEGGDLGVGVRLFYGKVERAALIDSLA